jgi:hypothetical protein
MLFGRPGGGVRPPGGESKDRVLEQFLVLGRFNSSAGVCMLKSLNQLDRRSYWIWAIPIIAAHWLVSIAMANGVNFGPLGPMDTLLVLLLSTALAGRFRDMGWPTWIGASFLVVTLLVLPVAVFFYAIASGDKPLEFLHTMVRIGQFTGPANILLVVVAGCVPGRATVAQSAWGRLIQR